MKFQKLQAEEHPALWGCERWMVAPSIGQQAQGASAAGGIAPSAPALLVKFIDARADLSVQVHPDDELARARHGKPGKTELWYVVAAESGAVIRAGFARAVTLDEYDRRVAEGTLAEVLEAHAAAAGDVFYLPAGTPHSLGGGVRVAEVQQPSDVTYRIDDFGRRDAAGRPRELHIEQAREAIDLGAVGGSHVAYDARPDEKIELIECPWFEAALRIPTRPMDIELPAGAILIGVAGASEICDKNGHTIALREGEAITATAATTVTAVPVTGDFRLLIASPVRR